MQLMLKAHEEHVDGVRKLSDDEIMAQSIVFLVAGFETTGKRKWGSVIPNPTVPPVDISDSIF